jgi:hypothetical protein
MLRQRVRRLEARSRRCGLGDAERYDQLEGGPRTSLPSWLRRSKNAAKQSPNAEQILDLTHEDWLEQFEAWGRDGQFDHEPDFPVALAFYRDALRRAKENIESPFDPPDDFLPQSKNSPAQRLLNWRTKSSFPEVHEGWAWLAGMVLRRERGIPPVTEAEFGTLAVWFYANADRLTALSRPSYLLVLDKGRRESVSNLLASVSEGARAVRAGEVAGDVRWLQTRYGGECSVAATHQANL